MCVPQTTLRLDDVLGGPTKLTDRIQIKMSQRKRCMKKSGRVPMTKLLLSFLPMESDYVTLPVVMSDNMHGILPTREAHLSFY